MGPGGRPALRRVLIAFDLDAIDASERLAVAMPEPEGISTDTAIRAIDAIAAAGRVVGFGPTATMARPGLDVPKTAEVVARLTEAAFG